jgi:hypothetical protein
MHMSLLGPSSEGQTHVAQSVKWPILLCEKDNPMNRSI